MPHHAYFVEGPLSGFETLRAEVGATSASAYERFGVDEARELIALASLKNFDRTVYLIGAAQLTTEAQQALLKLLEEPQAGTTFVFLVPHGVLLPTIKSRMQAWPAESSGQKVLGSPVLRRPSGDSGRPDRFVQNFLQAAPKERSEMVAELLEDDEGVRERARDFVQALEAELAKQVSKNHEALRDLAMVRDYLRDRSPSLKMLLEHLALSLPSAHSK